MRNALGNGDCCADGSVESLLTASDVQAAFQNYEMLIFILVDMHWHAVSGIGNELKHCINAPCLLDRRTDFEPLSGGNLQPSITNSGRCFQCFHRIVPLSLVLGEGDIRRTSVRRNWDYLN